MADTDLSLTWNAPDGSVWDWMDGTQGVILGEGIDGILFPDFDQLTTSTPAGRRYNGTRWKPALISATLQVADTVAAAETVALGASGYRRGAAWRDLDRRVRRSLSPTEPGRLVCNADGQSRFLDLRLEDLGYSIKKWPDIRGLVEYDVELADDEPFWKGEPLVMEFPFQAESTADYYGGGVEGVTKGPDFFISPGNSTAAGVLVPNPGEVEVWPDWTVTGPVQASVGVGDAITELPFLGEGESITLVTNPVHRSITDGTGRRAWDRVPIRRFAAIPAGDQIPVVVSTTDGGPGSSVRLTITPNFLGAY